VRNVARDKEAIAPVQNGRGERDEGGPESTSVAGSPSGKGRGPR
jgi:hypothetical protein